MKIRPTALAILLIPAMALATLLVPGKAVAAFNQNNLMDDLVFNDSSSMNAAQIDSFLNSFPSSCISTNNGFSAPNVTGYNPSQGFLYGANVSAGTIIYNAAQAYDLNPRVILTILQKEQSLVSGSVGCHHDAAPIEDPCSNPPYGKSGPCAIACQYAGGCVYIAMGYDCPQRCVISSTGFSKQVIRAAWKLKFVQQRSLGNYNWNIQKPGWDNSDDPQTPYGGYMTQGYLTRNTSGTPANYDGYRPVNGGAVTVHLDTGATASLYSYTPFLSGNQSFYNIYTGWFGLPYAFDSLTAHPNGALISDGAIVYLIEKGVRRPIRGISVFNSYNFRWSDVKEATTGDYSLPVGPQLPHAPGTLIATNEGVFVMNYFGGVLKKQHISAHSFGVLGYTAADILPTPPHEVPYETEPGIYFGEKHPAGTILSKYGDPNLYQMGEDGKLHAINYVALITNRTDINRIKGATQTDRWSPLSYPMLPRAGAMVQAGAGIYVLDNDIDGPLKRPVGPWECYTNRWHYSWADWYVIPEHLLPARTSSVATC